VPVEVYPAAHTSVQVAPEQDHDAPLAGNGTARSQEVYPSRRRGAAFGWAWPVSTKAKKSASGTAEAARGGVAFVGCRKSS
jgi:hypothetical protein